MRKRRSFKRRRTSRVRRGRRVKGMLKRIGFRR